jgi:hypothetical protein
MKQENGNTPKIEVVRVDRCAHYQVEINKKRFVILGMGKHLSVTKIGEGCVGTKSVNLRDDKGLTLYGDNGNKTVYMPVPQENIDWKEVEVIDPKSFKL